jgi:hypothetical protein
MEGITMITIDIDQINKNLSELLKNKNDFSNKIG